MMSTMSISDSLRLLLFAPLPVLSLGQDWLFSSAASNPQQPGRSIGRLRAAAQRSSGTCLRFDP